MTHSSSLRIALSALLLCACATGNDGTGDGSTGDRDGGQEDRDAGRRRDGGGSTTCAAGQHRCGGGCIDDLENVPENGCRYGCGEPCPTPPDGEAACDEAGACTIGCPPPFHLEGTECVCTPNTCDDIGYTCGAPDDGCGTPLDCGACDGDGICTDGTCSCPEDAEEPNDSTLAVLDTSVATIPDVNDWMMAFDTWNLHDDEDEDWYRFVVEESGFDNTTLTITLDSIPAGSDYDLSAYFVCGEGSHDGCSVGSPCSGSASGATSETVTMPDIDCSGTTSDGGVLYVRITSARWGGSCAPYSLTVHGAS